MKVHSAQTIDKIKQLRREGLGIEQIVLLMSLPKTTVWHHVHKIKLSDSQKALLRSNQGGSRKRKIAGIIQAEKKATMLLSGKDREFFIMASMLYWAEGHKKGRCQFTNTDGRMIALYLKILRYKLHIPEEQIGVGIRIFTGMKERECLDYWSSISGVSAKHIKVRMNDGGSSGRTKYGMCRVTVLKGHDVLKLMHAFISKISRDVIDY